MIDNTNESFIKKNFIKKVILNIKYQFELQQF